MAKDTTGRLHVTVKSAGKRKLSSKLWLERQLNDPYVLRAKREGFRSRAAFKLTEIDDKYRLLKPGMTIVDLEQLVGRTRAEAIPLGLRHIGIVELPLQPELRRQF